MHQAVLPPAHEALRVVLSIAMFNCLGKAFPNFPIVALNLPFNPLMSGLLGMYFLINTGIRYRILVMPLSKGQRKIAFNRKKLTVELLRLSDYSLPFT